MATQCDYEDAQELLTALSPFNTDNRDEMIYRGHGKSSYQLVPSALRFESLQNHMIHGSFMGDLDNHQVDSQQMLEYSILSNFLLAADEQGLPLPPISKVLREDLEARMLFGVTAYKDNWLPEDFLDIAALAQHYGLPTRLLDWSYDPFVAAYFAAVSAVERVADDGSADHGQISIWMLRSLVMSRFSKKALRIVRPPYSGNPNLAAQRGVFTYWAMRLNPSSPARQLAEPLDVLLAESVRAEVYEMGIVEHRLNATEAPILLGLLDRAGYGAARCFPGYDGAVRTVRERGLVALLRRRTNELDRKKDTSHTGADQ